MSIEGAKAFRAELNTSEALQAAVKGAADAESVARIGRENGFDITAGDIEALFSQGGGQLSEVELDLIAGGHFGGGYGYAPHYGGGGGYKGH
jgi:predicted ribosomally synthesized peptide with nif11-like leader